jgi:hypothetical protein
MKLLMATNSNDNSAQLIIINVISQISRCLLKLLSAKHFYLCSITEDVYTKPSFS